MGQWWWEFLIANMKKKIYREMHHNIVCGEANGTLLQSTVQSRDVLPLKKGTTQSLHDWYAGKYMCTSGNLKMVDGTVVSALTK